MVDIRTIMSRRVLILDGAMGTMIQHFGLTEEDFRGERFAHLPGLQKGNNDLLTLTRPDLIGDIHRRYLEAGADIIETNTFSSQRISMADYHCESFCRELNFEAAALARKIADEYSRKTPEKPRFVAGSVGPTNKTCSISPDVNDPALRNLTFDELVEAYEEQMVALISGGVDVLLIETVFDTLNAKAAIYASEKAMRQTHEVPIMLSVTVADKGGRMLSGQTLSAFLASVSHAPLFSVGLNCSFGAADMKPFLKELAATAPYYISAYPNAGLPNALGQYDQTPEQMAEEVKQFVDEGLVNIIGGCCGTTDAFIAEYAAFVKRNGCYVQPRKPVRIEPAMRLSGLECLEINNESGFTCVGERCNVAGSRKFLRLIKEKKYDEAIGIARKQVSDGARIIDINMDDGLLDTEAEMVHFLRLLASEPDVARVPFMVDSSKWNVVVSSLKCMQGKGIVNSISLKEGEETFISHAMDVKRLGAAVVVMAFDEKGQADTYERRIEICGRAYRLLTKVVGIPAEDIIFDPNILAVCTGIPEHDNYALDFIRATRWIRENLHGAHISGGVSNLSFSFRGNNYIREAMHAVFLHHAVMAGMDMGIVNPATSITYDTIPVELRQALENVIFNRYPDAADVLVKMAENHVHDTKCGQQSPLTEEWRNEPLERRLAYALKKGLTDFLEADLQEALRQYPHAVNIIEGLLMGGMNEIGELFGAGKMFLPQVVKSARTMKKAVGILQPYIEAEKSNGHKENGSAILATVKGDVHDIGKNIVSVVLSCNNYHITDLGVMCPSENIVEAALQKKVDFIGLSGLITPSLDEMVNTVSALKEAGLDVPVLIGGATTSRLHTALKIAPAYDGPVIWVKDASQMVLVAARLMDKKKRESFIEEIKAGQHEMRVAYKEKEQMQTRSLDEARKNRLKLF